MSDPSLEGQVDFCQKFRRKLRPQFRWKCQRKFEWNFFCKFPHNLNGLNSANISVIKVGGLMQISFLHKCYWNVGKFTWQMSKLLAACSASALQIGPFALKEFGRKSNTNYANFELSPPRGTFYTYSREARRNAFTNSCEAWRKTLSSTFARSTEKDFIFSLKSCAKRRENFFAY